MNYFTDKTKWWSSLTVKLIVNVQSRSYSQFGHGERPPGEVARSCPGHSVFHPRSNLPTHNTANHRTAGGDFTVQFSPNWLFQSLLGESSKVKLRYASLCRLCLPVRFPSLSTVCSKRNEDCPKSHMPFLIDEPLHYWAYDLNNPPLSTHFGRPNEVSELFLKANLDLGMCAMMIS